MASEGIALRAPDLRAALLARVPGLGAQPCVADPKGALCPEPLAGVLDSGVCDARLHSRSRDSLERVARRAPSAKAQPLTIVEVGAPAVNCVFRTSCIIPVSDSTGTIDLPYLATPGTAWLQSRTYT